MIVIVLTGKRAGQIGEMKGDLEQRKAAIGPNARVMFRRGKSISWERCDNLREATAMERGLFQ